MKLNPEIEEALVKIDFVKRYEELSGLYSDKRTPDSKRLEYVDGEEVMDIIHNLGYTPCFDKREKFFYIKKEKIGDFIFGVNIKLQYGAAELVWVVRKTGEVLLGSPWSTYSKRMINHEYKIKDPVFSSYEDLEEIFQITFQMYEDFKKALIEKRD